MKRTGVNKTIQNLLRRTLCTSHIHTNILCRIRFLTLKAVAGVKHCPISPGYCPTCKYRCLQLAGIYDRAREAWARHGTYIPASPKEMEMK